MWKKFINFINIPAHIKKLYLNWKIERFKKDKESGTVLQIINMVIIVLLIIGVGYVGYIYREFLRYYYLKHTQPILIIGGAVIVVAGYIIIRKVLTAGQNIDYNQISKIILKDEDDKNIRSWDVKDKTALLVGKKTETNQVDIDLSECTYSKLISREHGVINNTGENWYFEDIGSANGSGIKRRDETQKQKIVEGNPCLLNSGDTLYIANTKLKLK